MSTEYAHILEFQMQDTYLVYNLQGLLALNGIILWFMVNLRQIVMSNVMMPLISLINVKSQNIVVSTGQLWDQTCHPGRHGFVLTPVV